MPFSWGTIDGLAHPYLRRGLAAGEVDWAWASICNSVLWLWAPLAPLSFQESVKIAYSSLKDGEHVYLQEQLEPAVD